MQCERRWRGRSADLLIALGREPTLEELAARGGFPLDRGPPAGGAPRVVTSLDDPDRGGAATRRSASCSGPDPARTPARRCSLSLEREAVRRAVDGLPDLEREVIKRRFGIDGDPPQTERAVARQLGIRASKARAIEQRALARLARVRELEALSETTPLEDGVSA